jgi:prepilin-type N-terminal cleavage/methylation domain-containing protein
MRNRRGKTLIELLVVMTVMSTILLLCGRTIALMMRAEASGARSLLGGVTLTRFGHDFRRDVHSAVEVAVTPKEQDSPAQLVLQKTGDNVIRYVLKKNQIERVHLQDDEIQSKELFRFPTGAVRFEQAENPPLVSFVHLRPIAGETVRADGSHKETEYRVEAVPGRDHRFTQPVN